MNRLKPYWPIILLTLVWLAVIATNFPWGEWFIGWDALNPELNFRANFERVFTAMWQGNQGLGLLGGHGYAAILPHVIVTYLMSFVMPLEAIRPAFTFLMLYVGTVGAYMFIKRITRSDTPAFVGALFYMLNLGTLQTFYIQLEAFIVFFAALPWLLHQALAIIKHTSRKNLLTFSLFSFLASPIGFIPPLFLIYLLILALVSRDRKIGLILGITLAVNAFWLIPLGYYTVTRSGQTAQAYNNIMSTQDFVDKNTKYGTLTDVPLLRGFMWENIERLDHNDPVYVFEPWVKHYKGAVAPIIGYGLFAVILVGLASLARDRKNIGLIASFVLVVGLLASDVVPFSFVNQILLRIPILGQAFRTPFTKVVIPGSLLYGLFLSVGLTFIAKKIPAILLPGAIALGILFTAYPTFRGAFLYDTLILKMPPEYLNLISYFKTQPDGRIATLPQDCAEGWTSYRWGYRGSGFLHYGVSQPILDRSFDVWSKDNENYYREITQILRAREFDELDELLTKYDIRWVLIDPNVLHCKDAKGFAYENDLSYYLQTASNYSLVKTFGSISLYKVQQLPASTYLPNIGPSYQWTSDDLVYQRFGTYQTNPKAPLDAYFPFRALANKRSNRDNPFDLDESTMEITFTNVLSHRVEGLTLDIPNFFTTESFVPAIFRAIPISQTNVDVYLEFLPPEITLDDTNLPSQRFSTKLMSVNPRSVSLVEAAVNELAIQIPISAEITETAPFLLPTQTESVVQFRSGSQSTIKAIHPAELASTQTGTITIAIASQPKTISVIMPKVITQPFGFDYTNSLSQTQPYPCNEIPKKTTQSSQFIQEAGRSYLRLETDQGKQCLEFPLTSNPEKLSLLLKANVKTLIGRAPLLYVTSGTSRSEDVRVFLEGKNGFQTNYLVIPPGYEYGLGRSLFIQNYAITGKSVNGLAALAAWPVPYTYLESLAFIREPQIQKNATYVLSQAFDPGWVAWDGKRFLPHVLVNGWANGWEAKSDQYSNPTNKKNVTIFFLPQLLEWIGFFLLPLPFLFLVKTKN